MSIHWLLSKTRNDYCLYFNPQVKKEFDTSLADIQRLLRLRQYLQWIAKIGDIRYRLISSYILSFIYYSYIFHLKLTGSYAYADAKQVIFLA